MTTVPQLAQTLQTVFTTTADSATNTTASTTSTHGAPKPAAPASIAPYVSAPIPTTAATCPAQSNGTTRRGDRGRRENRYSATTPAGRLMKKIIRHLSSVTNPPTTGPAADGPHRDRSRSLPRVRVRLTDQGQRGRHRHRGSRPLHQPRRHEHAAALAHALQLEPAERAHLFRLTGDRTQQGEGLLDEIKGKVKDTLGDVKDRLSKANDEGGGA
jgi:hypothetical protein